MIKAKNLSKDFGSFRAVNDLSFEAPAGEIFGLLGPNGAGKTTTLRLLATTLAPTAGTAEIAGIDILKSPESVRSKIGVLTAAIGTYDRLTARENIRYFGRLYNLSGAALEARIDEIMVLLDMEEYADRRCGDFSTGMKQKVALARAVIHDPPVLIFDEPTSGLDVIASQTVTKFIKKGADKGKTVLLSTHNMTLAQRLCNRAAIIHEGAIIIDAPIGAILDRTKTALLEDAFLSLVGEPLVGEPA